MSCSSTVMGENRYHVKFSLISTNNLNYKETSPELIAGERKKKYVTSVCVCACACVCACVRACVRACVCVCEFLFILSVPDEFFFKKLYLLGVCVYSGV
jgi:hypothetical protein